MGSAAEAIQCIYFLYPPPATDEQFILEEHRGQKAAVFYCNWAYSFNDTQSLIRDKLCIVCGNQTGVGFILTHLESLS